MGFEPTPRKNRGAVFKTATISHSVTPPGFKFYFKTTSSGNFADLVPTSLPDFDPTWIIYEMAGPGITDAQGEGAKEAYKAEYPDRRF